MAVILQELIENESVAREFYNQVISYYKKVDTQYSWWGLGDIYADKSIELALPMNQRYNIAQLLYEKSDLAESKLKLAILLCDQNFITPQLTLAERHQKIKLLCKQSKLPGAWYLLGKMHYENLFDESDHFIKAKKCFLKVNSSEANFILGSMFANKQIGQELSGKQRFQQAEKYFLKANSPAAQASLGLMYFDEELTVGMSSHDRYQEAMKWFKSANTPDAFYDLIELLQSRFVIP